MLSFFSRLARQRNPQVLAGRRKFMQGVTAAGAAMLLSNMSIAAPKSKLRFVVIGAGFGGLAAAHEIKALGHRVTICEARPRISGRVLSFDDMIPGKNVEGGAELIGSNHPSWMALGKKFGLEYLDVSEEEDLAMPVILDGKMLTDEEVGKVYEEMDASTALLNERARAINGDEPWLSKDAELLDKQTIAEWVKGLEVSDLTKRLMTVLISSDHGVDNDKASFLGFLTEINGGECERYWTDSEVYRCKGGNMQLAKSLAAAIGDDNIRLGLPAKRISYRGDVCIVEFGNGREIECDEVILACPPSTWSRIEFEPRLPGVLNPQMGRSMKYLAAVKSAFWRNGDTPLSQYAVSDQMVSQTWEGTDAQSSESDPTSLMVGFTGGSAIEPGLRLKGKEREQRYNDTMEKLYTGYNDNFIKARVMDWPNDPLTGGGYSFPAPGNITSHGKIMRDGIGRLRFCGEHTCYKFVGYMEGALYSGIDLARRIAQREGAIPS